MSDEKQLSNRELKKVSPKDLSKKGMTIRPIPTSLRNQSSNRSQANTANSNSSGKKKKD